MFTNFCSNVEAEAQTCTVGVVVNIQKYLFIVFICLNYPYDPLYCKKKHKNVSTNVRFPTAGPLNLQNSTGFFKTQMFSVKKLTLSDCISLQLWCRFFLGTENCSSFESNAIVKVNLFLLYIIYMKLILCKVCQWLFI